MKSLGECFRIAFIVIFLGILFLPNVGLSQNLPYQEIGTRIDTIFEQRVIDGKLTTVRRIIFYDSVVVIPKLRIRKGNFLLNNESQDFFSPQFPSFSAIEMPPVSKNKYFSAEVGGAATIWNNSIQPQYPDLGLLLPVFRVENSTNPIITAGLYANSYYHVGDWYIKSGANLQTGRQNAQISSLSTHVDSTITLIPREYDTTIIDTLQVLDITQLPDTVYVTLIDTFTQTINDTLVHKDYDSTRISNRYKLTNRYIYLEIPLMVGRDFKLGETKLSIEAGFILSVLSRVRLRLSSQDYSIRQLSDKYAHTINLNVAGGVAWRFPVFDSRYLKLSLGVRYDFLNLYQNHNYHVRKKMRGSFAIGYYFN